MLFYLRVGKRETSDTSMEVDGKTVFITAYDIKKAHPNNGSAIQCPCCWKWIILKGEK